MLSWALTFFVVALIAGLFGFGVIATASVEIAQVLFVVFLLLSLIAYVRARTKGTASQ